jgi:hypothetical protein
MAANRNYTRRIVWSIAVLVLFLAIGLVARPLWKPLTRGLVDWTRHAENPQASAADAYNRGDWKRTADLSRPSLKTEEGDPKLSRVFARASARLGRDKMAMAVYDRLGTSRFELEDFFLLDLPFCQGRKAGQSIRDLEQGDSRRPGLPGDARSPGAAGGTNAAA